MSLSIVDRAEIAIVVAHLRGNLSINLGELVGTYLGLIISALVLVPLVLVLPVLVLVFLVLLLFVALAALAALGAGAG